MYKMEKVAPMRWKNRVLILSITCPVLCLIITQEWVGLSSLPVYVQISWAALVIFMSTWFSCFVLKLTLKANKPIDIVPLNRWLCYWLEDYFQLKVSQSNGTLKIIDDRTNITNEKQVSRYDEKNDIDSRVIGNLQVRNVNQCSNVSDVPKVASTLSFKNDADPTKVANEIDSRFVETWYKNVSNDKSFPAEAKQLLKNLLTKLQRQIITMDKIKLTSKLADVLLLHLKEYRRALRRVEKGTASDVEEAYRCLHPGSRSTSVLEHTLCRLVTILAREFLQWELTSSLPCKLFLSILARKVLLTIQTVSCPNWIFDKLLHLSSSVSKENETTAMTKDGIVSLALGNGITSATAAVIPRPLPKSMPVSSPSVESKHENKSTCLTPNAERPSLCLEGLEIGHRGLWGEVNVSEPDSEPDDDRSSPVYEEPTDFATTIARLRSLLQQKSTATTPLQVEEKSCVVYEGSQFTNLAIPWTEFYTAPDGCQQLLYCIQFDDVEQHGMDQFETTTATVRRQHSDFAQLHASLEEVPSLADIVAEITLPEGGRSEMENYLKVLCTRLASHSPPQLRHFLRPSSGAGKKADAVAPRLDRFLAKTVSGMFNTLKTVVPGFEMEQEEEASPLPTLMPLADIPWRFVEDVKSTSLASELQQLVAERIDYCSVDTAYEAVDSIEGSGDSELLAHWWETVDTPYDEELEELDCDLTLTRVTVDLICEVLAGVGSNDTLQQEAVVRWTKLLVGSTIEPLIHNTILRMFDRFDNLSFVSSVQDSDSEDSTESMKQRLLKLLDEKIPSNLKWFLGKNDTKEILKFLLGSLEIKKINQDLNLQILDVFASQLLASCKRNHHNLTI